MRADLGTNKDFLAGLLMIVISCAAFYMALDYPFGSTLRMGPGYFPRVLAGILFCFGAYVMLRGLRTKERIAGVWGWRALAYMCIALVVFGFAMEHLGFIPALILQFFIAAYGGHEFKFKEVLILTAVMCFFAWGVFIWGLDLPYELIKGIN